MTRFKRFRSAVCAVLCTLAVMFALPVVAEPLSGRGTWESTLQPRDIDGDGVVDAYYDTVLNITWLADWNIIGTMNWSTAVAWAAGLDVHGVKGWRLPFIVDTGEPGCDLSYVGGTDCGYTVQTKSGSTVYSEMAHMYYVTLGNLGLCPPGVATCSVEQPQPGWGLANTANFINMQATCPLSYWSGTVYAPYATHAWEFDMCSGGQYVAEVGDPLYAVAVRDGDIPEACMHQPVYPGRGRADEGRGHHPGGGPQPPVCQ